MMRAPLLITLAIAACASSPPRFTAGVGVPPYPDDDADGAAKGDACAVAGRVLWSCHCAEATRHADGMAFPAFCRDRSPGIHAQCIATHACGELAACGAACTPAP